MTPIRRSGPGGSAYPAPGTYPRRRSGSGMRWRKSRLTGAATCCAGIRTSKGCAFSSYVILNNGKNEKTAGLRTVTRRLLFLHLFFLPVLNIVPFHDVGTDFVNCSLSRFVPSSCEKSNCSSTSNVEPSRPLPVSEHCFSSSIK